MDTQKKDTAQVMSELKYVHWHEQLHAWRNNEMVYPRLLQLDPVAGCNHSCPFCTYRAQSDAEANANFNESDIIPFEDICKILKDCYDMRVKAVEITGGGEPSLHPKFIEMLNMINYYGFKVGLITNGTGKNFQRRLDEVAAELKNAEWVRFSVNGGENTHKLVHRGKSGDYEVVLNSIRTMNRVKSADTKVGVSFILWDENHQDIESSVVTAQELGCDYIRFAPALFGETTTLGKLADVEPSYPPDIRKIIEDALADCKTKYDITIIDAFSNRLDDREYEERYKETDKCYLSEVMAVIGADQHLYPCCVKKYTTAGDMGSIQEMGLKGLWESQHRKDYYKQMNLATMCEWCHFKKRNDGIAYAIDAEPLHTDFI